jgi:hypothetical protein
VQYIHDHPDFVQPEIRRNEEPFAQRTALHLAPCGAAQLVRAAAL